jgi:hypothetical protein
METRCTQCDKVLTSSVGIRLESCNFSSTFKMKPQTNTITYAWCDMCLEHAKSCAVRVLIIESERGWGQKVEDVVLFETHEDAVKFVTFYNQKYNNKPTVPDWYMYARIDE